MSDFRFFREQLLKPIWDYNITYNPFSQEQNILTKQDFYAIISVYGK